MNGSHGSRKVRAVMVLVYAGLVISICCTRRFNAPEPGVSQQHSPADASAKDAGPVPKPSATPTERGPKAPAPLPQDEGVIIDERLYEQGVGR